MRVEQTVIEKSIYHKNLMPVTYVIGDVAGVIESPVYAIAKMNDALAKLDTREFGGDGTALQIYNAVLPFSDSKPARPTHPRAVMVSLVAVFIPGLRAAMCRVFFSP